MPQRHPKLVTYIDLCMKINKTISIFDNFWNRFSCKALSNNSNFGCFKIWQQNERSVNFEMSFGVLQFSPKERKKFEFTTCGTPSRIVFVRFLGELKRLKRHFEINWPLV